jgi:hypothetical protein
MINDEINISIGFQCTTAAIIQKLNRRTSSFPFDWILSNPTSVLSLIKILIDCDDIDKFVKTEFFNVDGFAHFIKPEEFMIIHHKTGSLYNSKYNMIFPHEKSNYIDEVEKYKRRFIRLKEALINEHTMLNIYFIDRLGKNNSFKINNTNILNNQEDSLNSLVSYLTNLRKNSKFYFVLNKHSYINKNKIDNKPEVTCIEIESNYEMLQDEEIIRHILSKSI